MAHLVVWSPRAVDDVDAIAAFIAEDSGAYAASVVRTILGKANGCPNFHLSDVLFLSLATKQFVRFSHTVIGSFIR